MTHVASPWSLSNPGPERLLVWLEPWAEEFEVPVRSTITLTSPDMPDGGILGEADWTAEHLVLWANVSKVEVFIDGVFQTSGSARIAAPETLTKDMLNLLFADHPAARLGGGETPLATGSSMQGLRVVGLGIAITIACYLLLDRSQTNGIVGFFQDSLSRPMFACWVVGLVGTMIGPPTCAVLFWLLAPRMRYGWILHLALMPTIYALMRASTALMLFATGERDLDSLSGHASVPGALLMLICPIAYFAALGLRKIGLRRKPARL